MKTQEDQRYLLGIDVGTSAVKVALYTPEGEIVGIESEEYYLMPEGDTAEADPQIYWTPVVQNLRRILSKFNGRPAEIAAVSVSTFGETVFLLDEDGKSVRPSISWMDNRSQEEASRLVDEIGSNTLLNISGQADISAIWPATKFMWLARKEPEHFARTAKFLLPNDYILYRLSGEYVGEYTMWGSSLLMDIQTKEWSDPMIKFAGLDRSKLPSLTPSGTMIGLISQECAAETGLSTETKVVSGAMDQMCAAVGAGNITPGIVTESTGTVLALLATIPEPVFDKETKVPCHIHAVPDMYCLLPWSLTGGLVLKWFKDRFGELEQQKAQLDGSDPYDLLCLEAVKIVAGSDGLIMLPHLEGALFPEFNPDAKGVFFGITLKHTKAHFTRAIMEAVAYMIRRDLQALVNLGVEVNEIRVLGGGAKSELWSQIKADVCNAPVVIPRSSEVAVLGAAILAAVGSGVHKDIPTALKLMSREGERLNPNPSTYSIYEGSYGLYLALYDRLKDLFGQRSHPSE